MNVSNLGVYKCAVSFIGHPFCVDEGALRDNAIILFEL
jgi:hypothetical protein